MKVKSALPLTLFVLCTMVKSGLATMVNILLIRRSENSLVKIFKPV
jgi:hypothetical protein